MTTPPFLPEEIAALSRPCPTCGFSLRPDLWTRQKDPCLPVYPQGTSGERGMWQRLSLGARCKCGAEVFFDIGAKKLLHDIHFFGDDADRVGGPWNIHVYSLIGGTSGPVAEMISEVARIKRKYLPELDPTTWRIHTTELTSGQKRVGHKVYSRLRSNQPFELLVDCAGILKAQEEKTWNHAVFGFYRPGDSKKDKAKAQLLAKTDAHAALLSMAIYRATAQGLRPKFVLDASKPIQSAKHIEGWSTTSYLGSRHYPAHEFITHGNDIAAPTFATPGSHPLLELADVHAYFLARNLARRVGGESAELGLSAFGKFRYMAMGQNRIDFTTGSEVAEQFIPRRPPQARREGRS